MSALGWIFLFLLIAAMLGGFAKDDTDPPSGRSGLRIYIDHRTGGHYLGALFGGVTPRLDRDGRQIFEAPKEPKP